MIGRYYVMRFIPWWLLEGIFERRLGHIKTAFYVVCKNMKQILN